MKRHIFIFGITIFYLNYPIQAAGLKPGSNGIDLSGCDSPEIAEFRQSEALFDSAVTPEQRQIYTEWFKAAETNNIATVKKLINQIDVNAKDGSGKTALMVAARYGHRSIVKFLVRCLNADVNIQDKLGNTALIYATIYAHPDIVKLLLKVSLIDVNLKSMRGCTALMFAIQYNYMNTKLLLRRTNLNINDHESEATAALMFAGQDTANGDDLIKLLLAAPGLDINARDNSGQTALIYACTGSFERENIVPLLLRCKNIKINAQDNNGNTAFIHAAFHDYLATVKLLLNTPGIDINMQNNEENTALMEAVVCCQDRMVEFLLGIPGININIEDTTGKTALVLAVDENYTAIAQLISSKIDQLSSLAFESVQLNDIDTLKKIMVQIGNNIIDKNGKTLLDKACASNATEIIIYLLQKDSDPRESLASFPFEQMNPTSKIFEYLTYLAYGQIMPSDTKKRKWEDINICAYCAKKNCEKRCSSCRSVYYCDSKCQKDHWNKHKHDCHNFKPLVS